MKAFSNSLLAALIVAALFWGNCFSCPQLLLSLAKTAPHGCCHRSAPVTQKCTSHVLKNFVKADPVRVAAPAIAPVQAFALAPAPALFEAAPVLTPYTPTALLELTSPLRI